jgi:hypothetical protein
MESVTQAAATSLMTTYSSKNQHALKSNYLLLDIIIHGNESANRSFYIVSLLSKRCRDFLLEHIEYFLARAPKREVNVLFDSLSLFSCDGTPVTQALPISEKQAITQGILRYNYIGCIRVMNVVDTVDRFGKEAPSNTERLLRRARAGQVSEFAINKHINSYFTILQNEER